MKKTIVKNIKIKTRAGELTDYVSEFLATAWSERDINRIREIKKILISFNKRYTTAKNIKYEEMISMIDDFTRKEYGILISIYNF